MIGSETYQTGRKQRRDDNVSVEYRPNHLVGAVTGFLAERRTSLIIALIFVMDNLSAPRSLDFARMRASQLGSGANVST